MGGLLGKSMCAQKGARVIRRDLGELMAQRGHDRSVQGGSQDRGIQGAGNRARQVKPTVEPHKVWVTGQALWKLLQTV